MLGRRVALFPKCFILLFLVWALIDWDPITWYYQIQRWETEKVLKQWRRSTDQAFRKIYLSKCGISENTKQLFSSIVRVSMPSNSLFTAISNKIIPGNGYTPIYEKSCTESLSQVGALQHSWIFRKHCGLHLGKLSEKNTDILRSGWP